MAQDNKYATWKAYDNHFWPAQYLIAENGQCWQSVFSAAGTTRNDAARFQGKSD